MWAGWVHHSWRFGHAKALREMGPKCLNADQKQQRCQTTRSVSHLCRCNWRTFWRKNVAGKSPSGSWYCTMPRLTGHSQPIRNWPTWASNILITHPILRIWPRRTTTCSLDLKKNNWKFAIFRPTRRSLLPRIPCWTDNLQIFFQWLAKVRATG